MINDQMPPGMPPEMPEGMPPEMPPMPEAPMPPQGMPPGMIQTPFQSDALQVDEEAVNDAARKMIASSKKQMYGDSFDQFMEVLQGSENVVEDLAMISLNLIVPEINAVESLGMGVPYDYLMDVSAEVVSEAYDMAVQTGAYQPDSKEELTRNQNISLTMVAGELGKMFGSSGVIPQDRVSGFMESVMDGNYDNIGQEMQPEMAPMQMQGMPPQGMPPMPPPGMPPQGMPPQGMPPGMPPQEEEIL